MFGTESGSTDNLVFVLIQRDPVFKKGPYGNQVLRDRHQLASRLRPNVRTVSTTGTQLSAKHNVNPRED